ncbi:MAG: phage late control D family protein, partial [Spirochaetales bacterium]|nr:phage late control D family protein [Spirochaetales bacterium]
MSDKKAPPTFIVYLNGARMNPELEGRIKKIAITEKIDHITIVKMEFADAIPHVADNEELTPGSEIKIEMGYLDETDELFNGEITGMKIALQKGSASTCTITAKNHLHRLARIKKSRFYVDMTDTDIIKQIADEACLGADVDEVGTEHAFVTQTNQSDFDFIMELAERFNCQVWSEEKKLFFKQNQGNKSEDVVLEQDKTLITFHATRQTESLITEATVVSWDVDKQEAISGTVTAGDIGGNGPQLVQDSFGDRVNVVTNRAAIDNNAAEKLAKDILVRNAREFVRATGESEG